MHSVLNSVKVRWIEEYGRLEQVGGKWMVEGKMLEAKLEVKEETLLLATPRA